MGGIQTNNNKYVFLIGLHRSGTSILHECIKQHPSISGFTDTGANKDEGQFLQDVFPIAQKYGGPGKFAFKPEMHYTENSPLITAENKEKLLASWNVYWDTNKSIFIEKSPPNILKTRLLQEMFPNSYFILITRHPVATSYATKKWSKTSIISLLRHWIKAHRIFEKDKIHLKNLYTLKYELFVQNPDYYLNEIFDFIGVHNLTNNLDVKKNINNHYFSRWEKHLKNPMRKYLLKSQYNSIEKEINKFGYSLYDLES